VSAGYGRAERAAAAAAVALAAWQALAGLADAYGELARRPLEARWQALRASPEERVRAALGDEDFEAWRALDEHLPAEAHVLVAYARRSGGPVRLLRFKTLLYPRTFDDQPFDPARPEGGAPAVPAGWEAYVLDLDSGRAYAGFARCEELARGPGFRLLRLGSE
jgi:hypothetical protein